MRRLQVIVWKLCSLPMFSFSSSLFDAVWTYNPNFPQSVFTLQMNQAMVQFGADRDNLIW